MQQLLWFEIIFKGAIGAAFLAVPLTLIRIAGLQKPETGFWPRLAGALLAGIAAGVFITLRFPEAQGGIGPAGLVAINLGTAAALIIPLIMGTAAPTRRGRALIVTGAVAHLALAFLEIAHI